MKLRLRPTLPEICRDRWAWILVALCLCTYVPAMWWGLPTATSAETIRGWDVDGIGGISPLTEFHHLVFGGGEDWHVVYPLFHYLVLGIFYAPYLVWLKLTGGLGTPGAEFPYGFADPVGAIAGFSMISRFVTLGMATGTVLAAYAAAKIAWNRRAGIVTALIVMLSLPMVYRARTANLDVPVLFWTALGVVALAAIAARGFTVKRAVLVGLFAALATATKDQAYGGWIGAILVLFVLHWRGWLPELGEGRRSFWVAPLAVIVAGLVSYAIAAGLAFRPSRYFAHVHFILTYEEARFAFAETDLKRGRDLVGFLQLARDFAWTTAYAMGLPAVLLAVLGWVKARGSRFLWLLGGMGAGYLLLVMVPIAHMQLRYALLLVFLLAFPAGCWVSAAWEQSGSGRWLARAGVALAVLWLGVNAVSLTSQMLRDTRYVAGQWLQTHLQPGQTLGFYGDKGQLPPIPPGIEVRRLYGDEVDLATAPVDVLLVVPDYTSPPGFERSLFLPAADYEALIAGELPYTRAVRLEVSPPWGGRFPFVNPPVQVFLRSTEGGGQ